MIHGDVREVPCPTCGEVMDGWLAFGMPDQVTYCRKCESLDEASVWLKQQQELRRAATATSSDASPQGAASRAVHSLEAGKDGPLDPASASLASLGAARRDDGPDAGRHP